MSTHTRIMVGSVLLMLSGGASAICIPGISPGWECNFKNEDTHLIFYQPALTFITDERTDRMRDQAQSFTHNYLDTVKTSGDEPIRPMLGPAIDSLRLIEATQVAQRVAILASDPLQLMNIEFLFNRCDLYWQLRIGENCPTGADNLIDQLRLDEIEEVAQVIEAITENPALILGEQWGAIAEDVLAIREEFDGVMTLAQNLAPDELRRRAEERFRSFEEQLTSPRMTAVRYGLEKSAASATIKSTIADTLMATRANAAQLRGADRAELAQLQAMSSQAVGKMQAMEIDNMTKVQSASTWMKIVEQQINRGNLMALDYADEDYDTAVGGAEALRILETDPNNPTLLGNGQGFPR